MGTLLLLFRLMLMVFSYPMFMGLAKKEFIFFLFSLVINYLKPIPVRGVYKLDDDSGKDDNGFNYNDGHY